MNKGAKKFRTLAIFHGIMLVVSLLLVGLINGLFSIVCFISLYNFIKNARLYNQFKGVNNG